MPFVCGPHGKACLLPSIHKLTKPFQQNSKSTMENAKFQGFSQHQWMYSRVHCIKEIFFWSHHEEGRVTMPYKIKLLRKYYIRKLFSLRPFLWPTPLTYTPQNENIGKLPSMHFKCICTLNENCYYLMKKLYITTQAFEAWVCSIALHING